MQIYVRAPLLKTSAKNSRGIVPSVYVRLTIRTSRINPRRSTKNCSDPENSPAKMYFRPAMHNRELQWNTIQMVAHIIKYVVMVHFWMFRSSHSRVGSYKTKFWENILCKYGQYRWIQRMQKLWRLTKNMKEAAAEQTSRLYLPLGNNDLWDAVDENIAEKKKWK